LEKSAVNRARVETHKPAPEVVTVAAASPGILGAWARFWFTAIDPIGLHIVRVAAGVVFLIWLLSFAGHAQEMFGLNGWFDAQAYRAIPQLANGATAAPPVSTSWSLLFLMGTNAALITAFYWCSILVLVLFTAGILTGVTGFLSWLAVVSFTASPALVSDGDSLLLILAFYLMLGYALMGLRDLRRRPPSEAIGTSILRRILARGFSSQMSVAANMALRLLQVHFAILVVMGGLRKLQFGDWWSGLALWYPLHPVLEVKPGALESGSGLGLLTLAAYAVLAWQIAFPAFAWRPRWRPVLLGGALLGLFANVFMNRDPIFAAALFVGCLSYVTPPEWGWLGSVVGRLLASWRVARGARDTQSGKSKGRIASTPV
jgi:hypothetical protein